MAALALAIIWAVDFHLFTLGTTEQTLRARPRWMGLKAYLSMFCLGVKRKELVNFGVTHSPGIKKAAWVLPCYMHVFEPVFVQRSCCNITPSSTPPAPTKKRKTQGGQGKKKGRQIKDRKVESALFFPFRFSRRVLYWHEYQYYRPFPKGRFLVYTNPKAYLRQQVAYDG